MGDAQQNPARLLPFNALAKHLETQVRGTTHPATVNRYAKAMKNGEVFPPMTVAEVHGVLILIDGFHRRAAYEALGEWQAECEVVPCKSLEQALWLAFQANLRHGLPLKPKALRHAFRAYVEAGNNVCENGKLQSYRAIARSIPGSTWTSIWRWMEKDFPDVCRAMSGGMDGAEGGLRPNQSRAVDPPHDLTMKALDLLDGAQALMEGVHLPALRQAVAERAMLLVETLEIIGAGTKADVSEDVVF